MYRVFGLFASVMRLASSLPKSLKEEVFSTFCNGACSGSFWYLVPAVGVRIARRLRYLLVDISKW